MNTVGISCVRNGAKYLPRFLDQLSRLCLKVFILDDRSTDNIKEICDRYPKVCYFRNDEEPFHGGRNWRSIYSKIGLLDSKIDWVIGMDVDELVIESEEGRLLKLLEFTSPEVMAWSFQMYYCWNDEHHYRADTEWYKTVRAVRVFRYVPDKLPIDTPRHATSLPENIGRIENCGTVQLLHFGYMDKEDRVKKYNYYRERDKDMIESGKDNYKHMIEEDVEVEDI